MYKRQVSDNGDDTEAGLLAGAEFTAYLKSSLSVKADGSYDFDKATPVVIGENGATTITDVYKRQSLSLSADIFKGDCSLSFITKERTSLTVLIS